MKRIKKVSGVIPTRATLIDGYSNSDKDGFTAKYINEHSVVVSPTEPVTDRKKVWMQHSDNLFDGEVELGDINGSTGQPVSSTTAIRSKNYIDVRGVSRIKYTRNPVIGAFYILGYDENKDYIGIVGVNVSSASYIKFTNPDNSNVNTKVKIEVGQTVIEDKTYILNDNDVYEEYVPKSEEIYNTTEQRIGTWISGKPLYRKTIVFPNGTGTTSMKQYSLSDYGITNVDEIFLVQPSFYSLSQNVGFTTYPLNYYDGNKFEAKVTSTVLQITLEYANIANSKCVITLEYTKTTD